MVFFRVLCFELDVLGSNSALLQSTQSHVQFKWFTYLAEEITGNVSSNVNVRHSAYEKTINCVQAKAERITPVIISNLEFQKNLMLE